MQTDSENVLPEMQTGPLTATSAAVSDPPVGDSAMATGTDDEPEMTIADKHAGESVPDLDGDGELSPTEAAKLLGDAPTNNKP